MEKGVLPELQGKSLDDIEIEDHINTDGSDGSESENGTESENMDVSMSAPVQTGMQKDHPPKEAKAGCSAVLQDNTVAETERTRKRSRKTARTQWSNREVMAVMKHFKSHITTGKLATMAECLQCKDAEYPVLAGRTAQNIRDFVRNRGITFKRKSQCN
ncbi:hypothetical protein PDJAM_G00216780 [Pangasius djambal]|uniref:Uncharacterized protein n=1 Tax=Pangasius djambal TaxID=1691987 RepID=A0ACC5YBE8_9TELE|nr:hypothetical protein [Pangasius djambal]